jgi:hypothetical protein
MSDKTIEAFWRDAKAADIAKVMKGENVEARFRDSAVRDWKIGHLNGWADGEFRCDLANCWVHCQVYDPPEWLKNKPDPGEGWRLLDPFTDEQPELGDCMFDRIDKKWISLVPNFLPGRRPSVWYRRRIEPVKQDAGSTCASNIPKGWTALLLDEPRLESDAYWSQGAKDWIIIGDNRVEYANRDKWPAIRQRKFVLAQGESHKLPNGLTLEVYKKGFEVY